MSSCAASCFICCHPVSCASVTSDSSPTAIALRFCHYAANCLAAQKRYLLRQHHRPPIRTTHSGTALSAAQPCASSNGSPPRNSCSARHLNQTGTQHESPFTSSTSIRASARTRILCLLWAKPLGCQPLPPLHRPSSNCRTTPSGRKATGPCPTRSVPHPSAPLQTDSKYIGFHVGGFLQVAVSEAPRPESIHLRTVPPRGAPDTALRLMRIDRKAI